jgi:hypothetical protein
MQVVAVAALLLARTIVKARTKQLAVRTLVGEE